MAATMAHPRLLAVSVLAGVLALSILLLTTPGKALASHEDCTLVAEAPTSYYGVATITSGSVDCASPKTTIRFSIALTRDGSLVDSGERRCHRAATCWSYLLADDPPGDQRWCTLVSARVGSHTLAEVVRCEEGSLI
jgi:hypothetical protein